MSVRDSVSPDQHSLYKRVSTRDHRHAPQGLLQKWSNPANSTPFITKTLMAISMGQTGTSLSLLLTTDCCRGRTLTI